MENLLAGGGVEVEKVVFRDFCPFEFYERVQVSAKELLVEDLEVLFQKVSKKIRAKVQYLNPRFISVTHSMHYRLFIELYRVVRDLPQKAHIKATVKKYKGKPKKYRNLSVVITKRSVVVEIMIRMGLENIKDFLGRELSVGVSGVIVVTKDKPFQITYNSTSRDASIQCHYEVTNEYGIVI